MKKTIARLRILGLVTFAIYIVLLFTRSSNPFEFNYTQAEQALIFVSLASFVVIMALQVYRFYISNYSEEDDDNYHT